MFTRHCLSYDTYLTNQFSFIFRDLKVAKVYESTLVE